MCQWVEGGKRDQGGDVRQGHSEMVSFISGVIGQTLLCLTCVCQWPRVVFAVRPSSRCGRLRGTVVFAVRSSSRCGHLRGALVPLSVFTAVEKVSFLLFWDWIYDSWIAWEDASFLQAKNRYLTFKTMSRDLHSHTTHHTRSFAPSITAQTETCTLLDVKYAFLT